MALKDIPKFKRLNNVSISVCGYQEGNEDQEGFVYPLKVSKEVKQRHVDLLLITNDDTNPYCYIKDFRKLVGSQYSKTTKHIFVSFGYTNSIDIIPVKIDHNIERNEEMKQELRDHEENCFAYAAHCTGFSKDPVVKYNVGEDAVDHFLDILQEDLNM